MNIDNPLELISGIECPSCGRENDEHAICTSTDCPGVQLYSAAPKLFTALKLMLQALEADVRISPSMPVQICFETNGRPIQLAREAIAESGWLESHQPKPQSALDTFLDKADVPQG